MKMRRWISSLFILGALLMLDNSCKKEDATDSTTNNNEQTVKDVDGNTYHTVKIGTQTWMLENLKVTHYRNGDPITRALNNWHLLPTGGYCYYNNDTANVAVYGLLYNWNAVKDSRNIAPVGWHVPSDADWNTLRQTLGNDNTAGVRLEEAGYTHWMSPSVNGVTPPTNETGFTALPGGRRNGLNATYYDIRVAGYWWTTNEYTMYNSWVMRLINTSGAIFRYDYPKDDGYSVRCVKD